MLIANNLPQKTTFCKIRHHAGVVELVDTLDSKSGSFGSNGSSPFTGTNSKKVSLITGFFCARRNSTAH